ncbi:MAG: hypothetical protein WCD54_04485, partial [Pseudolabrys sp.]
MLPRRRFPVDHGAPSRQAGATIKLGQDSTARHGAARTAAIRIRRNHSGVAVMTAATPIVAIDRSG